jgi:hypothetical protein
MVTTKMGCFQYSSISYNKTEFLYIHFPIILHFQTLHQFFPPVDWLVIERI